VKRFADLGVTRVVASFRSEKAAAVLPIVDRWTAIMRNGILRVPAGNKC
jgi:hypothetical protein